MFFLYQYVSYFRCMQNILYTKWNVMNCIPDMHHFRQISSYIFNSFCLLRIIDLDDIYCIYMIKSTCDDSTQIWYTIYYIIFLYLCAALFAHLQEAVICFVLIKCSNLIQHNTNSAHLTHPSVALLQAASHLRIHLLRRPHFEAGYVIIDQPGCLFPKISPNRASQFF